MPDQLTNQFFEIKNLIHQLEQKYQREPDSVRLLIASKGQSSEKINTLYQVGHTCFGESYVQEALPKIANHPQLEWHFIGPIQRNKTKKIAEHFAWVQSIDNILIAERLNDQRPDHLPPLNICIEININQEITKSGINEKDLFKLAEACLKLPRLKLRGLMCIPPLTNNFLEQRKQFQQLFFLQQQLKQNYAEDDSFDTLSMGMSYDFEAAIAEGATLIRLGRVIWNPNFITK